MLTSITPLGERGRGNRWRTTSAWLVFGHVVGGFALGLLLAGVGALFVLVGVDPSPAVSTAVVSVAVLGGAVFDLCGGRMPGRRQVDERWLTKYRGWVYGLGFGAQLGFGFVTVVNTALFVSVCVAGVLLPVTNALLLGVVYGSTRGLVAASNGRIRSTAALHRMHRRLDRYEKPVRWGAAVTVTALALGSIVA
ncbi:MAG: hypothetical protein F4Y27_03205 [Acidimicrobiaceae bacterium]|nr:hypothetical protein [Acidimicrobiaceae bacterium]MXW62352.1 hypothetical protein [Acidimicrobiaceae bacterium]MXW74971.1 hypothetical protein [Acidimicrobiaceae bacterium]MYA73670.1 hypothetical protein [Acidimicrobiaceae bacterium]MYC41200.1 hypothetical protein [Acidimicrobiaceae bacterium]